MEAAGAGDGGGRSTSSSSKRGRGAEMVVAAGAGPGAGTTASRIYRVRATGGKDRHSKVYTAKGIRDRRVRLSVATAIQFYDLQDRLGFDQPSKAIEWLINAASPAIDSLPSLDPAAFASIPTSAAAGKSGCSSTSETTTSKGSELSLSRDKEVTVASAPAAASASFTDLLIAGGGGADIGSGGEQRQQQSWQQPEVTAAGKGGGGGGGAEGVSAYGGGFSAASSFGDAPPIGMVPAQPFNFSGSGEISHYDHLAAAPATAGDYNLNFSMSSGFLGANRGTLQSNSPSSFSGHQQQHLQRLDGSTISFLLGHAAAAAAHPAASEGQLTSPAALQLWDGFRRGGGMKEKSKN